MQEGLYQHFCTRLFSLISVPIVWTMEMLNSLECFIKSRIICNVYATTQLTIIATSPRIHTAVPLHLLQLQYHCTHCANVATVSCTTVQQQLPLQPLYHCRYCITLPTVPLQPLCHYCHCATVPTVATVPLQPLYPYGIATVLLWSLFIVLIYINLIATA